MVEFASGRWAPSELLPPVFDDLAELSDLPRDCISWPLDQGHSAEGSAASLDRVQVSLRAAASHGPWEWPDRPIVFVSDPHADAEGFLRSLVAAGTIRRFGAGTDAFALTAFGRRARIVIGGDCLDKGPSNLDLLDAIAALFATGADVHLLAGNHDLRLFVALVALAGPRTALSEHLFVRMARKAIPLLREIWDRHDVGAILHRVPDEAACRAALFPDADWPERFAQAAGPLGAALVDRELQKLDEKTQGLEAAIARAGLTMRQLYGAVEVARDLFLSPGGAYHWFYQRMKVVERVGSILFVHAGLCDEISHLLVAQGPDAVNSRFLKDARRAPFRFYTGQVGNLVRTKYRLSDRALTEAGVRALHGWGIKLVVQGHVNNHAGQRLVSKRGLLHLEGDVTLDRASRSLEGLSGIGAGATLIYPSGDVVGLSADYPKAKHFQPASFAI